MTFSLPLIFIQTTLIAFFVGAEEDIIYYFMDYDGRVFNMKTRNLADFRLRLGEYWSPFWYSGYRMTIKTASDHRISLRMESVEGDGCYATVSLYSNTMTTSNELATNLCRESDYEEEYVSSNETMIIKYYASFFASKNNFEFTVTSFYQLTIQDENKCPTESSLNCGNKHCVSESLRCNDRNNCGNDADEDDCDLWVVPVIISLFILAVLGIICCIVYMCMRSKKKRQQGRVLNQARVPPNSPHPAAVSYHNRTGLQQGTSPASQPSVYIHQAPGVYVPGQYPPSPPQTTKYPGKQSAPSAGLSTQWPGQSGPQVHPYPPSSTTGYPSPSSGYNSFPGQVPEYQLPPGQSPPGYQAYPRQPSPAYQASPGQPSPGYQTPPGQPSPGYQTSPTQPSPGYQASPGQPSPVYQTSPGQPSPNYQASPGQPSPVYQTSPGYPSPGYQASPGQSLSGYQTSPRHSPSGHYQQTPGYNVVPGGSPSSGYQLSPSRSHRETTPSAPPPNH